MLFHLEQSDAVSEQLYVVFGLLPRYARAHELLGHAAFISDVLAFILFAGAVLALVVLIVLGLLLSRGLALVVLLLLLVFKHLAIYERI